MSEGGKPRFVVADDHPLVRQGVRLVLEAEFPDGQVIEAHDLDTALDALVADPDTLLLIDLDMPGMDGTESLRALREEFPALLIAVLSGNSERQTIVDSLNAGVNGYILKASPPEELLYAISTIRDGRLYLNNVLWKSSISPGKQAPAAPPAPVSEPLRQLPIPLTPRQRQRQRQVTQWLMKGHSNKQIARALEIGEGTVKIHLALIFRTLGAQNRTEAVMIASRLGL
jgi:DNA-binding NarL/FixJ family response regulator